MAPMDPEVRLQNLAKARAASRATFAKRKAAKAAAATAEPEDIPRDIPQDIPRKVAAPPPSNPAGNSDDRIAEIVAKSVAAAIAPIMAMMASERSAVRESFGRETLARTMTREPVREGIVVEGRNGEQLTRTHTHVGDVYDVPLHVIPKGWSYQWNAVTVHNNPDMVANTVNIMYANGWRPVPADRHPGMWKQIGATGDIVVNGLRLEERPMSLTVEAKREDEMRARAQVRDQIQGLRMTAHQKMPSGFSVDEKYRGTRPMITQTIDQGVDIPRPQLQEDHS